MTEPTRTLAEIRSELALLLKGKRAPAEASGNILALVDRVEREIDGLRRQVAGQRSGRARGPRTPATVVGYSVEPGRRGDRTADLCEIRDSGAPPFRCPRNVYDEVAMELVEARAPIGFTELHKRLKRRLQPKPANYLVRMCLRFWVRENLVAHSATLFEPLNPAVFLAKTGASWEQLELRGSRGRR